MDPGWVDLDLYVPTAAQPLLPNSHQPRQNWADNATLKSIQPSPQAGGTPCICVNVGAPAISMLESCRRGALVGEVDDSFDDLPLGKLEVAEVDFKEARRRRGLITQHSS